jgi:hypothetical protein
VVKKLSLLCFIIFILFLMANPAVAQIGYCKDINPTSQPGSDFDEEVSVSAGTQITVDVQVNDVPNSLITGGVAFLYDPNLISVISTAIYDGEEIERQDGGTNWDPGFSTTTKVDSDSLGPQYEGLNGYIITCGNFSTVSPVNGDIPIARFVLEYKGPGETSVEFMTVPGFDTLVGDATVFDGDITPNIITLNQGTVTTSTTSPSTTTSLTTSSTSTETSTTTTEPSSSSWGSAYAMMWEEDKEAKLSLLRAFRNQVVVRNEVVRDYVSLLYQHSSEILGLLITHPFLCHETSKVVEALIPSIKSFFENERLVLTAGQKDTVETFLDTFEPKASPELKGIIQNFKRDLRNGRLFLTVS